ncbi:family 31 glycosyltransferase, partial [Cryphonectria parasitica EP155]
ITLEFPPKKQSPDASKMIFGVATTLDRMPENLRNFQHWAARTSARLVVVHEPRNETLRPGEPSAEEMEQLFKGAGIERITLVERDQGWGERFVSLLGVLHDRMEPQVEWAVLMDDDTFFLDLDAVQAMLAKYNPSQLWYVGALSDNKWNINNGGLYAVGGAGIFISRPLLETMRPFADGCFPEEGTMAGGDTLVGQCIHRHTTTKLTLEHGLYQLDLHGDVTGFYEAPRPQPLSVHHWKSWHHHDIPAVATVARVCGRPCVLQNFRFQDGWQMSNGFSIVKYGYGDAELAVQHPQAMEHTWKHTEWEIEDSWDYSFAPLKERDEGKVQFLMEKSVVELDGSVTLYYVRRKNGIGNGLIRMIWR